MTRPARVFALVVVLVAAAGVHAQAPLAVSDPFALPAGPGTANLQATPATAFGANVHLVVWRQGWHGKGGSARIRAARVSADGALLDSASVEIAPAAGGVQERPRVAFAGGVFLVAWQDLRNGRDYDVLGARVSPAGKVLDAEPITIAAGAHNQALPDVAGSAESFMVVWQGVQGDDPSYRGFAAPIDAAGKVGKAVETGLAPLPKVAWNGAEFLAAGASTGTFQGNVRIARLKPDGTPVGQPVLALRSTKAVAYSVAGVPGRGWIVLAHRSPPDPWGWGGPGALRAALISPDGRLLNGDDVKDPSNNRQRPLAWLDVGRDKAAGATWPWGDSAAGFDGRTPIAVWQRHHLAGEKMTNFQNCDLVAARLDVPTPPAGPGLRSLDPAGVPVAAGDSDELHPALSPAGDGRSLLVYERRTADRSTVEARLVKSRQ